MAYENRSTHCPELFVLPLLIAFFIAMDALEHAKTRPQLTSTISASKKTQFVVVEEFVNSILSFV